VLNGDFTGFVQLGDELLEPAPIFDEIANDHSMPPSPIFIGVRGIVLK
jgi:hypothetical protein